MHLVVKLCLGVGLLFGCTTPVPVPSVAPSPELTASVPSLVPSTLVTPSPVLSSVIPTPTPVATPTLLHDGVTVWLDLNQQKGYQDGPLTQAKFGQVGSIAFDLQGDLYFFDSLRIRKLTQELEVITLAGNGELGHHDGIASYAQFTHVHNMVFDQKKNLWFLDDRYLRWMTPEGEVKTYHWFDGQGNVQSTFPFPVGLNIDPQGSIYVLNSTPRSEVFVYVLSPDGQILSTLTQTINPQNCEYDTADFYKCLNAPESFGLDSQGKIYIFGNEAYNIMRIGPNKTMTPLAGSGNRWRDSLVFNEPYVSNTQDDARDGLGLHATFKRITQFTYSKKRGMFYLVDFSENCCIRSMNQNGEVNTLTACSYKCSGNSFEPHVIALHPSEDVLYILDNSASLGQRLLKRSLNH